MKKSLIFFSLFLFYSHTFAASGITYHGRIMRPGGLVPVNSMNTQFRIQIQAPNGCLLWEETQTKDLSSTEGVFTVTIADNSEPTLIPNTLPYSLERVFSNRTAYTGLSSCTVGTSYNPSSGDGRNLQVYFREAPTDPWEQMPLTKVNFVPLALNSVQLEGYSSAEFLKVASNASYTTLTAANVNTLLDLIAGTNAQYVTPTTAFVGDVTGNSGATVVEKIRGTNVVATAPTLNQVLKFNGTNWVPSADDTGSAPADASYSVKGIVQINTDLAQSGLFIAGGVLALPNVITAGGPIGGAQTVPVITYDSKGRLTAVTTATINDTTKLPLAGGTMTGSIDMGTQNITNATSIAATNFSGRNLLLSDNDTNRITISSPANIAADYSLMLPTTAGTSGYVLSTNGSGVLSWINPSAGSVTGVSSANSYITVATGSTTPVITAVVGTTANTLAAGDDSRITGAFQNGGNTVSATATLGTNSAHNLEIETGGTTKMTILNDGKVGIGTTTPSGILDVQGGTSAYLTTAKSIVLQAQTGDGVAGGAVNITSGAGTNDVNAVGGAINLLAGLGTFRGGSVNITGGAYTDGATNQGTNGGSIILTGGASSYLGNQAGNIHLKGGLGSSNASGGHIILEPGAGNGTGTAGNVGIGTTTPGAKLEVAGQIKITGGTPGAGKVLQSDALGLASWVTLGGSESTAVSNVGSAGVGVYKQMTGSTVELKNVNAASSAITVTNDAAANEIDIGVNAELAGLSALSANGFVKRTAAGTYSSATALDLTTDVTGALPIANGGTGQITAAAAINALLPTQTGNAGKFLSTNATSASWVDGVLLSDYNADVLPAASCTNVQTAYYNTVSGLWACQNIDFASTGAFVNGGNTFTATATLGSNSAHNLEIETGGTTKMTILNNGNVGIGTTNPTTNLEFGGDSSRTISVAQTSAGAGKNLTLSSGSPAAGSSNLGPGALILSTGNTTGNVNAYVDIQAAPRSFSGASVQAPETVARFHGEGQVGIGTSNYPFAGLYIATGTDPTLRLGGMGRATFAGINSSTTLRDYAAIQYGIESNVAAAESGNLQFSTIQSGTMTEVFRINGSGNVGIGTNNPGAKLEVAGQIKITGGTPGAGKVLQSDATGLASWATLGGSESTSVTNIGTAGVGVFKQMTGSDIELKKINAATTALTITNDAANNELDIGVNAELAGLSGLSANGFVRRTAAGTFSSVSAIDLTSQVTGALPIANGGTGQTTANAALNALLPAQATNAGKVLSTNGTDTSWITAAIGTVTNVSSANNYITVATGGTTPVITAVVGTTANTLAAGDDSRITGAFQNGGNTFTAAATIGSNSAHNLEFETGGTTKMTLGTNGNLGIGTNNPTWPISIEKADSTAMIEIINTSSTANRYPGFNVKNYMGAVNGRPKLSFINSRGDSTTSAPLNAGDSLGGIEFSGVRNTTDGLGYGADIAAVAEENFTAGGAAGTYLRFSTASIGANGHNEKVRISADGNMGIGTNNPGARLEVAGQVKITGGTPGAGKVLTSDAAGLATWAAPASGGITTLNTLNATTQTFANGATGTEPAFVSATSTHTLNIPLASGAGVTSGTISKTDYDKFNAAGTIATSGTSGGIPYYNSATSQASSGVLAANGVLLGGGAGISPTSTTAGAANMVLRVPAGGGAPSFGLIDLTTSMLGVLPIANGGTNSAIALTNGKVMVSTGGAIVEGVASATIKTANTFVMRDGSGNIAGAAGNFDQVNVNGSVSGSVGIVAPSTFVSWNMTLPIDDGTSGQFLSTNGSGVTSWVSPSLDGLSDAVVSGDSLYVGTAAGSSGSRNTGVGTEALDTTTGDYNTSLGYKAIDSAVSGNNNTAIGAQALELLSGASANNVAIGYIAGQGTGAHVRNQNVLVGALSGSVLQTGSSNVMLGYNSGNTTTTGGSNILIGANVIAPAATTSSHLNIGNAIYGDLATGNIGIGTASPLAALEVQSASVPVIRSTRLTADTGVWRTGLQVKHRTSGTMGAGFGVKLDYAIQDSASGELPIASIAAVRSGANNSGRLSFNTYDLGTENERMIILPNGNVGIGTAAPGAPLHVSYDSTSHMLLESGGINVSAIGDYGTVLTLDHNGASGRSYTMLSTGSSNYPGAGYWGLFDNTVNAASSYRILVAPNGNVGIGTGATAGTEKLHVQGNLRVQGTTDCTLGNGAGGTNCSSDSRLKMNIQEIVNPMGKILSLRGVEFDWNERSGSPGRHDIGVIAQDVEKVFPTAVIEDSATGFKKVDYAVLVAPLIQAFKDMHKRVESLFKTSQDHSRRIASVEEENARLKSSAAAKAQEIAVLKAESEKQKRENQAIKAYLCAKDPAASICK